MSYVNHGVDLSKTQLQAIMKAITNGTPVSLRLTGNAIKGAGVQLSLTKTQINKLNKADSKEKGSNLILSASQLKKIGGSLINSNPAFKDVATGKQTALIDQEIANTKKAMKTITPDDAEILKAKKEGKLPDPSRKYSAVNKVKGLSTPMPKVDELKPSATTGKAEAIIAKKVQKGEVKSTPLKGGALKGKAGSKSQKGASLVGLGNSSNLAKNVQKVANVKTDKQQISPLKGIKKIVEENTELPVSKNAKAVLAKAKKINPILPPTPSGTVGNGMVLLGNNPSARRGKGLVGLGDKKKAQ